VIGPAAALERLREGNRRFASGRPDYDAHATPAWRRAVATEQRPFAAVLGCSDSRVPAEIVFDQGLGDLFVVRVAGNVAAPAVVGSVEFAVAVLGVRLVVVLGHSRCGAILAVLEEPPAEAPAPAEQLRVLTDLIRPVVAPLLGAPGADEDDRLVERAVRRNVVAAADTLRRRIPDETGIAPADLTVAGAAYSLDTGLVDFFDAAI